MIGKTISHYKILEKLGEGGMGMVYKAQDTRLKRMVALKFLPLELTRDEEAKERFMLEAQAASALDHPNICTIHEIDETEAKQLFIAMACYEGETLKQKLARGPLQVASAIEIVTQVAKGLAKAHEQGIVHRDIKPANIIVTKDDVVKIVDFGLAKLTGVTRITRTGTAMGTVAYMSPEQAQGEPLDHRTDIWSLGVVLYEMISGELPFRGEYEQAVIYSILHEQPELGAEVPVKLQQSVEKALSKSPEERYQKMDELLADTSAVKKELESRAIEETAARKKPAPSIAVLPFVDMSPQRDQEYFCDGMAEELIDALTKLEGLKVVSRTSAFSFKGQQQDIRKVGKQLNVSTVLEGSVRKAGDRLRITAQLIDVEDGYHLWSEKYDRTLEDVFAIQDDIARTIVSNLKTKLVGELGAPLVKRYTENLEAYNLYLKGRYYWNRRYKGGLRKGMECFKQAIEEDPLYALPYTGLADSYNILGFYNYLPPKNAFTRARAAARKALEIDDTLAEAHTSLGLVNSLYEWNWLEAEKEFKRALQLNPNYGTACFWYAIHLMAMGRCAESLTQIKRAQELEPLSLIINTALAWTFYYARRYDQAIEECNKVIEMDANFGPAYIYLGWCYLQTAMFDEAIAAFQKAITLFQDNTSATAILGHAYAIAGKTDQAQKMLDELRALSKQKYVSSYYTAVVYVGLNQMDRTFKYLEKAYEERNNWLIWLKVAPEFDSLRSERRFTELLEKVGLET